MSQYFHMHEILQFCKFLHFTREIQNQNMVPDFSMILAYNYFHLQK